MREGTGSRWVIHGREENSTIHDECGMRHFYAEWSRRMGRKSYDPYKEGRHPRYTPLRRVEAAATRGVLRS